MISGITCCLVPSSAQVYDEEVERGKRRTKDKEKDKDEVVRWKRNKSRSKGSRSESKSKSKSSSKERKKKKKTKKEKTVKVLKSDSRDDDGVADEDDELSDEDYHADFEVPKKETKKPESKATRKVDIITSSSKSVQSERKAKKKDNRSVFRDPADAMSIKSDPLPGSLPKSILAESFYSDDSLDDGTLTFEVDYSTSTPLFEALELNDWGNVLFFLRAGKFFAGGTLINENLDKPETQVRTWVHCRDEKGEMMWRQLPLHGAICLGAPLVVVQRLVELYPDALACPDSFGNLPLNLAAKLHGTDSYIFQVVSLKSQRWLQARQDSDDDQDESTVGTRERDVGIYPDPHEQHSFDRPRTPAMFERPLTPTNLLSTQSSSRSKGMDPSGSPPRVFVERLHASYDDPYSSDDYAVEREYKIYQENQSRQQLRPNESNDSIEYITHVY